MIFTNNANFIGGANFLGEREMEGEGSQDTTMVFKMSLNDIFTMKTFEKKIVTKGIK